MYQVGQRTGDYEILDVLGAGAMGQVYKVRNVLSDRVEAMKVLLPNLEGQQELSERFLREIKVQATLQHKNIATLHTAQRDGQKMLMMIEYVDGITLESAMQRGRLSTELIGSIVLQVLDALAYAHSRGVVHRDIKPANVMLTRDGTAKLMDFGIARFSNGASSTKAGRTVGSLYYMSPEQIRGAEDLDARSDYYSLGITLYEMATGQRPFEGDSEYSIMIGHLQTPPRPPVTVDPNVPAKLNDVILLAIEKDREKRFQSAGAFSQALRAAVGLPAAARTGAESTALYDSLRSQQAGYTPTAQVPQAAPQAPQYTPPAQQYPPQQFASQPPQQGALEVRPATVPVSAIPQGIGMVQPVGARPPGSGSRILVAAGVFALASVLAAGGYWYWKSQQAQEEIYTSTGKPKDPEVAAPISPEQASQPAPSPAAQPETTKRQDPPAKQPPSQSTSSAAQQQPSRPATASVEPPRNPAPQVPVTDESKPATVMTPRSVPSPAPRQSQPMSPVSPADSASAPALDPARSQKLDALRKRYNEMSIEFATAKDAISTLEGQMRAQGLSLRADVKQNVIRTEYLMKEAMDSLRMGNADATDEKLDQARLTLDWLKRFLNQ